jgi:DNA topoisomerase-2
MNTETTTFFDVQMKTDKQHILEVPDTYVGSVENIESNLWIMNEDNTRIILKTAFYVPGLYKIFDEAIVNCRDHVVRMQSKIANETPNSLAVTNIEVEILLDGSITMTNNGNGMDVAKHSEYDLWIPEMIFAHLRTSTNYNKSEKKITGGKNGFGVKLAFIWSTYACIETVDHIRGLKYVQEFENNLDIIHPPKITKCSNKPYTKITFKPDYERYKIPELTNDIIGLFKRRVYDIAAVTDKTVKVKYNGTTIPIKNFEQYINMYIGDKSDCKRIYETSENGRWEYAVALTPMNEFIHVSFVNGIYTSKGGKHVEYIINQITRKLVDFIEKKKKVKVNVNTIKEQIILFLRCDVENPSFDSQTKDFMNTSITNFGSRCEVSDKFVEKVAGLGIMDTACAMTEIKEQRVAKKADGVKTRNITGIPKLVDANWAGTAKSKDCILILTEGDSAKAGVVSGMSSEDRNRFGIYPVKGKLLNVKGQTMKNILENEEIRDIKQILALENKKEYKTIEDVHKHLRYGKIVFMTDQDTDGSHIKGLGINLFQCEWNSLFRISGFISFMNTPIIKAKKASNDISFYNIGEYEQWKHSTNTNGWNIKYYKGLGTSIKSEFVEYFKNPKIVNFIYEPEISDNSIDMAFNKKRAEDRKFWLENIYDRNSYLNTSHNNITYSDFVDKELIHFSKYDCERSIPNLIDGFKISTRKIMFSAFKKNLTHEIKVAQFSGYVSEHSCYHHGEESLNKAIIGLAQNYVGSNNINLLVPSGQFGTRLNGGKDSASPRYTFTKLENITRYIFSPKDDQILNYLNDDGVSVEPQYYVPIIPMILVNGTNGIGTGFSSDVLCYNIIDIINYLKNMLQYQSELNNDFVFIPYYEGFRGQVIKLSQTKFMFKGIYEKINNDVIRVTELPVGMWTQKFKELVDKLESNKDDDGNKIVPVIKEKIDNSTDDKVDFTITFTTGKLQELEDIACDNGCNGLEKMLKLFTTNTTTNMNLFNADDKLVKYDNVGDIINEFYATRIKYYQIRKDKLIEVLQHELNVLNNKTRYIQALLNDEIDLRRKNERQVNDMLSNYNYDMIDDSYSYLTDMKMSSVCNEKVDKLKHEYVRKEAEVDEILNTTVEQMWLNELHVLENAYNNYLTEKHAEDEKNANKKPSAKKTVAKKTVAKPKPEPKPIATTDAKPKPTNAKPKPIARTLTISIPSNPPTPTPSNSVSNTNTNTSAVAVTPMTTSNTTTPVVSNATAQKKTRTTSKAKAKEVKEVKVCDYEVTEDDYADESDDEIEEEFVVNIK